MNILIATPLYPPDTTRSAKYVKELATRFSAVFPESMLRVVTYVPIPEEVTGVEIHTIGKQLPTLQRLFSYTRLLAQHIRGIDLVILENGPSTELPLLLVSFVRRIKYVLHISDPAAQERSSKSAVRKFIADMVRRRALRTVTSLPNERPEVLPFSPYPTEAFAAYEKSWQMHLAEMRNILV